MLDCVTVFTVSSTVMWAVLTGPTYWVCHIETLTLCVESVAYSCIIVKWWSGSGGIQAWSRRSSGFLQCFDTVGLVIWLEKIIPEMTYNVLSDTLSLYTTTAVVEAWIITTSPVNISMHHCSRKIDSELCLLPHAAPFRSSVILLSQVECRHTGGLLQFPVGAERAILATVTNASFCVQISETCWQWRVVCTAV